MRMVEEEKQQESVSNFVVLFFVIQTHRTSQCPTPCCARGSGRFVELREEKED